MLTKKNLQQIECETETCAESLLSAKPFSSAGRGALPSLHTCVHSTDSHTCRCVHTLQPLSRNGLHKVIAEKILVFHIILWSVSHVPSTVKKCSEGVLLAGGEAVRGSQAGEAPPVSWPRPLPMSAAHLSVCLSSPAWVWARPVSPKQL